MKILRKPEDLERGAIGRTAEEISQGLLFVLPRTDFWPIVMEGMDYALDVYWVTESGIVVEQASLIPGMDVYWPEVKAKYVMEFPMQEEPRFPVGTILELPL